MENKEATSEAKTAYGKKLDTAIPYSYKWTAYLSIDEIKSSNDMLSDEEIVKVRNDERQANARNKALAVALKAAGYEKPTEENDPQLRLRNMFRTLMSSKRYTEEAARALASTTLALEWDED